MDIRRYFSPKNGSKRKRDNDGDEDDDFQVTKKKAVKKKSRKGGVIFDSDSDSDDAKSSSKNSAKPLSKTNGSSFKKQPVLQLKKTPSPAKMKEIDVASFFGSSPVQRSDKKTGKAGDQKRVATKPSVALELEDHSDEDFQETLEKLDKKSTVSKKTESAASKLANKMRTAKVLAPETPEAEPQRRSPRKHIKQETPTKSKRAKVEEIQKAVKKEQTKSSLKIEIKHKPVLKESPPKTKVQNKDGGDSAEKKKGGGQSYRSYLQREGPRFLGAREFPKGEEGCLEGLSFVFTGVIEYFDKDELKFHIEKLGGAIRTSISKKTSYVVIGREPGESKTQKAEELKIKTVDEEGLYNLISSRPGRKKSIPQKSTDSKPANAKLPANVEKPSASSKLKDDSTVERKEKSASLKDQFSWTPKSSNTQSQESDSQGSGAYSQESLGKPGPQDIKTDGQSQGSPQMWVDKYKPNSSKQIIGQQGAKSNAKKLAVWLERWQDNNFGTNKERAKFNRDEGFAFKGALLSGPPGVGKTTTAQVVCQELGFTYFELNASDARNKKTLQQTVSEYLDNTVLGSFFAAKSKTQDHHKHCLIMDEVDGMSGNEDRGGIQELIQLIKGSRVPVICICNDRSHPKIRSLCNYCFDLRFQRPRLPQIKGAMLSVAFKEGVKIPPQVVENMIMASNQDVRQVLHNMSMWAAGQRSDKTETKTGGEPQAVKKDLKMGAWDVVRQVFSSSPENKEMTFNDKVGLFFHDYSIAPLFVQENYTNVVPHKAKGDIKKHLDLLSQTADSIAMGDLVDRHIRGSMAWKLLPLQAVFASVLPGEYMRGHMGGMINFPSWLGKNSSRGKSHRLLQELQTHMRMSASSSLQSINQEYLPQLRKRLTDPLLSLGSDGTTEVVDLLNSYDLTREDFDNILELTQYSGFKEPMKSVPPKVKSAFTRAFNKSSHLNPYGIDISIKAKSRKGPPVGFEDQDGMEGDTQEEEEEDDRAAIAKLKVKTKNQPDKTKKGKGPVKGKGMRKGAK